MRRIILVIAMAAAFMIPLGCGTSDKPSKVETRPSLKLATMTAASHTYNQGAAKLAELVKARTNGRLEIVVYPDGQLGKGERELLEAVQQGTIDIYVGSTGPISGFSPSMAILDIPFLFENHAHVDRVLDGPVGKQLMEDLDKTGLKALAFWENGFRNLTNSKRPVRTPEEAKGLKIRTMENKIHLTAWKAIGVNAVPMAWGEVYGALQQGTIDGQENPVAVIYSSQLNEVQKYLSLTQHVYSPAIVIVSAKRWQGLSPEDREVLAKTALEVASFQRRLGRENEEKQVTELERKGMKVVRKIDKELWRKAMAPAVKEFEAVFGREKIAAIMKHP